jgi:enoyl-CoA hydratase/carnithine racemase
MPTVEIELRGPVAVLTLNSPQNYNALSETMLAGLSAALEEALADANVGSILLTGAGSGFCAGATLSGNAITSSMDTIGDLVRNRLNPLIEAMRASPKPIVVAVNGPAAGAGAGIALAGDIVLAGQSARFLLSFVKIGAVLDAGTSLIQRLIGPARARGMALLGAPVDAAQAEQWGLIWKAVADEVLMDDAMKIASALARGPRSAIATIKDQLEGAWAAGLPSVLELEASSQAAAFRSADALEGITAFQERRAPRFSAA